MFFTKRKAIILIIICSIFFILTYKDLRSEEIKEISGNAKIIDGDTIKIIAFFFCKKHILKITKH